MSAGTPPPAVLARRHVKPQYLAPGQHLKVASRRPPTSNPPPPPAIPRDPWEAQDAEEAAREARRHASGSHNRVHSPTSPHPPYHPYHYNSSAAAPPMSKVDSMGGSRSPRGGHSASGHPYSSHLSRSRSNANSEASFTKEASQPGATEDTPVRVVSPPLAPYLARADTPEMRETGDAPANAGIDGEEEEDENYYRTTEEVPVLSAAERAQRVLEMQHQALEERQLKKLTEQGVARRPKTLVRNRHGRLQAIAAPSSATSAETAMCIEDAPVTMKAKPRPGARVTKPKLTTTTAAAATPQCPDDLVNSRPSTPTRGDASRLDIDLD